MRPSRIGALALLLAGAGACVSFLREPKRPAETFSHRTHEPILLEKGFSCATCHPFTVDILEPDPDEAARLASALLVPGKETCHHCHAAEASPAGRCTLCHQEMAPLLPKDHDALWESAHGARARSGAANCDNCHAQTDCVRCHVRRDTARRAAHDATFQAFHALEARLEPGRCQRCHVASYCVRCHEGGEASW